MVMLIFFTLLGLSILVEGVGIRFGREISYILLVSLPIVLLFLLDSRLKTPKNFVILSAAFFVLSALSLIFSANIPNSFAYLLFYGACFVIFVISYNFGEKIKPLVLPLIIGAGIILSLYSIFLNSVAHKMNFLIPGTGLQFVFPDFASHNLLGDFLALPLLICIYFILKKKYILYSILGAAFFLPYFIFSYSRSGYLALIVGTAALTICYALKQKKHLPWVGILISLIIIAISINFSFVIVKDKELPTPLASYRTSLFKKEQLPAKYLLGSRDEYIKETLSAVIARPLLGFGPGNFYVASQKYTGRYGLWTISAHNIFLDLAAENGIIAGIVFLVLVLTLMWRAEKNIYFFLALTMLVNFQVDYTYRIYAYLMLFFILLGITNARASKEKAEA